MTSRHTGLLNKSDFRIFLTFELNGTGGRKHEGTQLDGVQLAGQIERRFMEQSGGRTYLVLMQY